LHPVVLLLAVAAYMAVLFRIAWGADRPRHDPGAAPVNRGLRLSPPRRRAVVYALSLAVYCTSWTYFGAVGAAARSGWDYLPIYLGPALALLLGFPLWRRVALAAKRENVGSIADFLAARYGKSRPLGALVAVVATLGSLPYIALQLKSLATGWSVLLQGEGDAAPAEGTVLAVAAALAGFAILFGARRADLTEHNRGLVQAVAFESVVKLGALLAAALLALALLLGRGGPPEFGALAAWPELDARFLVTTALSAAALLCLPRQFHVGFVELVDVEDAREARRTFVGYLALTTLAVVPIVAAGALLPTAYANPDLFVLDLPMEFGGPALTLLVLIGGFSAATAMVIVETVALSAMLSNELVLPWAARWRQGGTAADILLVRRAAIILVLVAAWGYFLAMDRGQDLASIGLIAFAAAAQLAPALIGAVVWQRASGAGALAGIGGGFALWLLLLGLPQVLPGLRPAEALGVSDPLVFGALVSLSVNAALFVAVSRRGRRGLVERIQAAAFVKESSPALDSGATLGRVGDLKALMIRFLGESAAVRSFADLARELDRPLRDADPADPVIARAVERRLAGAVGASSARGVIAAALSGEARGPADVTRLLDEAAQAVQFSRELLQATLDNMSQAVSVVDGELRLIAWNARYVELFEFPLGFIHVGKPVAEVIRYNAERGECGPGGIEVHVSRRLEHLRRRSAHSFERLRPDGRVIRSVGAPMPGGGYVTTYTDVTEDKRREALLEERVEARTRELAEAMAQAEAATASKTRFLAAASHDLLQPLNAARLFVAALAEELQGPNPAARRLARDADRSIVAADRLLRALLNLSKLEAGGVTPEMRPVAAGELLASLEREFLQLAAEKGLRLRVRPCHAWVRSDRDLLRSLLQNLIVNAIRYTDRGGVLVGARVRGASVRFEVWDTGRGIPAEAQSLIFREFTRLPGPATDPDGGGMGLGLAIVERVARLLGHRLSLRSRPGRGSVFAVAAEAAPAPAALAAPLRPMAVQSVAGLKVLCVDNEASILESLQALLRRWGIEADTAASCAAAERLDGPWDAALIDHHLGGPETGLDVLRRLQPRIGRAALVTAETEPAVLRQARALGAAVLKKPVEPAALKAFLASARAAVPA